jgi:REP element-mobilizing transposase RayT
LWLKEPRIAASIVETIQRGDSILDYFALHAFVVMPNHVHLLITPKISVPRITNGIKGSTSHQANSILSREGQHFWQDESFDHWVRSPKQFDKIRAYRKQPSLRRPSNRTARLALVQLQHLASQLCLAMKTRNPISGHSDFWLSAIAFMRGKPKARSSTTSLMTFYRRNLPHSHPESTGCHSLASLQGCGF